MTQYVQDNDERMPNGEGYLVAANNYTGDGSGWGGQVYPYAKSTGVFKCPDDSTAAVGVRVPVSYCYNENAADMALAQFQAPASTVLLFETSGAISEITRLGNGNGSQDTSADNQSPAGNGVAHTRGGQYAYATGPLGQPAQAVTASSVGRHTEGSNFLLADSHAKFLRGTAVSAGTNNPSAGCPQGMSGSPCAADSNLPAASTDYSGPVKFAATFSLE
jgi:prepilin-type processing-associated H-X9-DG protein